VIWVYEVVLRMLPPAPVYGSILTQKKNGEVGMNDIMGALGKEIAGA